nr:hypothetical protein [Streptomyces antimycoticus]
MNEATVMLTGLPRASRDVMAVMPLGTCPRTARKRAVSRTGRRESVRAGGQPASQPASQAMVGRIDEFCRGPYLSGLLRAPQAG